MSEDYSERDIEISGDSNFKWPDGYWERYEVLRLQAKETCGHRDANICVLKNGYFEVRYTDSKGGTQTGPQCSDRIEALNAFIAQFKTH